MPLAGPNSYPTTMQEIIAHWTSVNASLGATPLLLKGAYSLANFTADRTAIVNAIVALEPFNNALQQATSDRDIKKTVIKPRNAQFRNAVRYFLQATPYENALSTQPKIDTGEAKFLKPLDDMANLWAALNALPATGAGSIPGFTPRSSCSEAILWRHLPPSLPICEPLFSPSPTPTKTPKSHAANATPCSPTPNSE